MKICIKSLKNIEKTNQLKPNKKQKYYLSFFFSLLFLCIKFKCYNDYFYLSLYDFLFIFFIISSYNKWII